MMNRNKDVEAPVDFLTKEVWEDVRDNAYSRPVATRFSPGAERLFAYRKRLRDLYQPLCGPEV